MTCPYIYRVSDDSDYACTELGDGENTCLHPPDGETWSCESCPIFKLKSEVETLKSALKDKHTELLESKKVIIEMGNEIETLKKEVELKNKGSEGFIDWHNVAMKPWVQKTLNLEKEVETLKKENKRLEKRCSVEFVTELEKENDEKQDRIDRAIEEIDSLDDSNGLGTLMAILRGEE